MRKLRRRLLAAPSLAVGMVLVLAVLLLALFAPSIADYGPFEVNMGKKFLGPGPGQATRAHWLGTDHLGRDILARMLFGTRISLLIGLTSVVLSACVGIPLGLVAGYYRGRAGDAIMRLADVQYAFPFIVLAIAIIATFGSTLTNVIVTLALWSWAVFARVARAETLAASELEYVLASKAQGATDLRILAGHILPNISPPLIVIATTSVAQMILAESALSFLGMGVPPSTPSLGTILGDGRSYMNIAWWVITFPGLMIMLIVLGVNLFGDGLRDW